MRTALTVLGVYLLLNAAILALPTWKVLIHPKFAGKRSFAAANDHRGLPCA